ncbi:MAG: recombinase family protein [Afipia sp.]|nr:recombinase family protein [Afipia sp.]
MTRAAIYARFSSDLQKCKSIGDQIALCREVCAREGLIVVSVFEDRAISGSHSINRPGFSDMMRAAEARKFDVIVAEDMDRIFRDQGDYHTARKRLDFLGITFHTASGKVSKIDGALRALMGEVFIENLALHTRRGLEGVIRDGRHAGGRAYGYRAVPGKKGELEIIENEAAIVRQIFADYLAGRSPRDIAGALNGKRVRPPRGDTWNASTINGNAQRGGGILQNEIYAGRIVWNKVRMVKDPTTGKRLSRPNPKDQYRVADAPHLRIIDQATWEAARAIKAERGGPHEQHTRRAPRMLSGLLKCGSCDGSLTSIGEHKGVARLQCSTFRESGTCDNGRRIKRDDIERAVLSGLQSELASPAYIAEYVKAYNEERAKLARTAGADRNRLEKRLAEIGRELDRAINAIVKAGVDPVTLAGRMRELESERAEITASLESAAEQRNIVALHPAAIEQYRSDIARLAELLPRDKAGERDELIDTLRSLIASVTVYAKPNETGFEFKIEGRLEQLLDLPVFPARSPGGRSMVAREGLEPPTPGL